MNCNEFKDLMTIHLYGNLTENQLNQIESHKNSCTKCESIYTKVITTMDSSKKKQHNVLPKVDWERSWDVIKQNSITKKDPVIIKFSLNKFFAAAAAITLIVLASLFSDNLFNSGNNNSILETETQYSRETSIQSYSEQLELIALNFKNRRKNDGSKEFEDIRNMENEILSDMLVQTKALLYIASERNNQNLRGLLEGIEIALMSMKNINTDDPEINNQLDQFIRENTQQLKLQEVSNTYFVYETRSK